jgi:ribose transport system ATP-binding protein
MIAADSTARLEIRGVSKSFGTTRVLDSVDLTLLPGSVLALLGTNGAGKSTLIKIISGIYRTDSGAISIDGVPAAFANPGQAIESGISLLPQETSAIPDLTVAENILLGQLPVHGTRLDRAAMRARASELLAQVGLQVDADMPARRLNVQQLRLMEIARALARHAKVLILDEPTASLSEVEAEHLFVQLNRLRAAGTSIIYISHYLDEVFALADEIVVLRDGRVTGTFDPRVASEQGVLHAMLGRALDHLFPPLADSTSAAPGRLRFEGVRFDGTEPIDLEIAGGEIIGIFGLVGSGYDRIGIDVFSGISRLKSGRVMWRNAPLPASPTGRVAAGIGYVAADRKRDGIVPEMSLADNICLPTLRRFDRGPRLNRRSIEQFAERQIRDLSIKCDGPLQPIRELSGGNQQKACVARWIDAGFDLIVMEEPTRGVDLGARADIYRQMRGFADKGGIVLLISSDVEEVAGMADRSIIFEGGRVARIFPRASDKADLMAAAARGRQ